MCAEARSALCDLVFTDSTIGEKQGARELSISGKEEKCRDFLRLIDRIDFRFSIVAP